MFTRWRYFGTFPSGPFINGGRRYAEPERLLDADKPFDFKETLPIVAVKDNQAELAFPPAAQAIKNAGIAKDKIVLAGFDFCCGEKEALEAGIEDATVAQFPAKMAELGVDALVKAIRGEKVESLIDSGAALVTPENMANF